MKLNQSDNLMKKNIIKQKIKAIISKYLPTSDKDINFKILAEIADLRMGKIKEGEKYINTNGKMKFIDQLGNEFLMAPSKVKRGQWSPYESSNIKDSVYHMKELQEIASQKNGKIKEGEYYINSATKMKFIDQLGKEFEMTPNHIKKGCWSPYESGNVNDSDYHMQELQEIISKRGGKIKEGEYYIRNKDNPILQVGEKTIKSLIKPHYCCIVYL